MALAEPLRPESPAGPHRFAVIMGAMKSGTTTLFEMLAQHPQIAEASVKEPGFFSNGETFEQGYDWYRDLWEWDPGTHEVALEASPAYTTYPSRPGVPQRMVDMPNARFQFIYILRDPVHQIQSTVRHTLYAGWGKPLDDGIPEWMIENASYAAQLDEFTKVFPEERFLVVTLEEYSERPREVLRRICAFLGVDRDFQFRDPDSRYNTGDVYETARFWAWFVKWRPARFLAKWLLPRSVRHRIRSALRKLPGRNESLGRYEMTDDERAWVIDRLSEDLQRLESHYGVDTSRYWSITEGRR